MGRQGRSADPGSAAAGTQTVVGVAVVLIVAPIHALRAGSNLRGSYVTLYYSYFSDIVVPFGMYFLLCVAEKRIRFLADWRVKILVVLGGASATEVMQAFGVPMLGRTFDPLDFAMFGVGVLMAALVDKRLLDRILPGWNPKPEVHQ